MRGLTLNYEVSKIINFEAIKTFVLQDDPEPIVVPFKHKIARAKFCRVETKAVTKKYNRVPAKRRILPDYSTLPFGYVD